VAKIKKTAGAASLLLAGIFVSIACIANASAPPAEATLGGQDAA